MKRVLAALLSAAFCAAAVTALGQTTSATKAKPAAAGGEAAAAGAPTAEAVYDQMVEAWHKADSIYYESDYQVSGPGAAAKCNYKVWLKKPNYARLEAYQDGKLKGALVGDGSTFYIYWPGSPPSGYVYEDQGRGGDKAAMSYVSHPAPAGKHSIAADVDLFGIFLSPISDPSMFSNARDPMQQHIESGSLGSAETVGGEKCDVLHLKLSKGRGETTLWLSQGDRLPRKEKEVIIANGQFTLTEAWSNFKLNGAIAEDKFAWAPQKDWRKIRKATLEDGLLKPGAVAPGFTLAGVNGEKISLSDFKGKVVWLHIWSAG